MNAPGMIGAEAAEAVPVLAATLDDGDVMVWAAAATALGNIGPGAKRAVPCLIAKLKASEQSGLEFANRSKRETRLASAKALGQIGISDKDVIAALRAACRDRDRDLQEASELALKIVLGERPDAT